MLIVCMDENEHIYKKGIYEAFTNHNMPNMMEIVRDFTGQKVGATYFRNQPNKTIDGIWATPDMTAIGACILPTGYGVGNHMLFIIDLLTSSLLGCAPSLITRCQAT